MHPRLKAGRLLVLCAAGVLMFAGAARAMDVDGPDCGRAIAFDFGDAPEGIPAYPLSAPGIIGHFPTCLFPSPPGTQTGPCPFISPPPGATGYVKHAQAGNMNYWLGCYGGPLGPLGIDAEPDGKVNTPAIGISACAQIPTDCVEALEGGFDQDECTGDGSDATLRTRVSFVTCRATTFPYDIFNCGTVQNVFLNILVDWNKDGDWNDNLICPNGMCAYEWAVVNVPVVIMPGCNLLMTPPIFASPVPRLNVWMRISISSQPMPPTFPWDGTATGFGAVDFVQGGETEDYLVNVENVTPVETSTWGSIKALYR